MIEPGAAIVGLDMDGHIWIVLSDPTPSGQIVIVSLSKHGRPGWPDHARCTIIRQDEYPVLYSDSCVMPRSANLNPLRPLLVSQTDGRLSQRDAVTPAILGRIQQAVLDFRFTLDPVRNAIRRTIERDA